MKKETFKQYLRLFLIVVWLLVSLFYIASEPNEGTPLSTLFIYKGIAFVAFVASLLVGRILYSKGMLPKVSEED